MHKGMTNTGMGAAAGLFFAHFYLCNFLLKLLKLLLLEELFLLCHFLSFLPEKNKFFLMALFTNWKIHTDALTRKCV